MEGSSASVTSQVSKSGKRKWTLPEDAVLISCMIDQRNMGTHNADTGFKSGYLPELEKMLLEKLTNCGIKARPHVESRLKTLKREWAIVYDMMLNIIGFGWDSTRKMVMAEDDVWETYVATHKEAAPFKLRSFPHFEELSMIYAKGRATGKDAQAVEDILQELEIEDLTGVAKEADVNHSNPNESANDIYQEKFLELPRALRNVDGLTSAQVCMAIQKFSNHPNYILLFFGTEPEYCLEMVQDFLANR
ncbi:hypothetical protein CDL15_Pgr004064 [Punica granatum]|uniref:Myb/SANT-like domain-containing protein n=1 Tax=Punica granatum TaxID=22663 RepID=A0A218XEI8_PUNGR|nr:hypothetical protein CDL15_Pgr004064 [Punica granatum]